MKIKLLFTITLIFAFSQISFAQGNSVSITSDKITYERKGEDVSEYKKTFTVNYPKISNLKSDTVKTNLENTLNYWKVFDTTLEENLGDYTWLSSLDYKINYNKNSILDVQLIMEGSGAYPSASVKNLIIDLKTGKQVQIADAFTNIGLMLVKIDKAQQQEITKAKADARKDGENIDELLGSSDYENRRLEEFSVSDKGVTFLYDYEFPHAILALQPDGRYFFTFNELKPFIKRNGLLGQFIR